MNEFDKVIITSSDAADKIYMKYFENWKNSHWTGKFYKILEKKSILNWKYKINEIK